MNQTFRCLAVVLLVTATGCRKQGNSVRLKPSDGEFSSLITAEVTRARARNLRPFLELRAEWCGPCKALEASMGDARMADAFAGTFVISVDIDEFPQVEKLGFDSGSIPVFFELDAKASPTGRRIDGGAWGENIAANMAPPLKAFFAQEPN